MPEVKYWQGNSFTAPRPFKFSRYSAMNGQEEKTEKDGKMVFLLMKIGMKFVTCVVRRRRENSQV